MALLWFLLGIAIIFCIGRYNESNKLFWVLLISFIGSFTAATVVYKTVKGNKSHATKVYCPTQGSEGPNTYAIAYEDLYDTYSKLPKPVSYGNSPKGSMIIIFKARLYENENVVKLLKPPIQC